MALALCYVRLPWYNRMIYTATDAPNPINDLSPCRNMPGLLVAGNLDELGEKWLGPFAIDKFLAMGYSGLSDPRVLLHAGPCGICCEV